MVQITEIRNEVFGNCLRLENGIIELEVSLDFGPRILHFSLKGKENMFYNDLEKTALKDSVAFYGDEQLRLYGGHRIWISPEVVPRCYHPDNLPVTYKKTENGVIVSGPIEEHTNIQKIMKITVYPDKPEVGIDHSITNHSLWDIEFAVWCITIMDAGGKTVIPIANKAEKSAAFLPNRNISLWEYTAMNDKRVYWGKDYITINQQPGFEKPFKIGVNNDSGWGAYFNKGQVFLKFFTPIENGILPDNGCNYEVYANNLMLEMETLGEMEILAPGETVSHMEEWEIYESGYMPGTDEDEITKEINKFLNK